jgi:predicted DNA-binding transcriptional regulator AlpA
MSDGNSGNRVLRRLQLNASDRMITVEEFAALAGISRRQIDRLRTCRPDGFPTEFELGSGKSKFRRCPRFRISEVQAWLDSRALW